MEVVERGRKAGREAGAARRKPPPSFSSPMAWRSRSEGGRECEARQQRVDASVAAIL